MAVLTRQSSNEILLSDLRIARSMFSRLKGLLGTASLAENQGLWIHRCNSIHTFFMNYAIDCVFLDRNLVVRSIKSDVKPWKMIWPQWKATTVVEMKSGQAVQLNLKLGDQLHVGT